MSSAIAIPVDLQAKRQARGESQETFGKLLGVTRQQVYKYESGNYNIPTPQACEVALMFDGITLEYKGVELELRPKQAVRNNRRHVPELGVDMTPVDGAWSVSKELRDVEQHLQALFDHATAVKQGRCEGKQWVTTIVKEVAELVAVCKRYLRSSKDHFPEEWAKGMTLALAELAEKYGVVNVEIGDTTPREAKSA